MNQDLYDAGLVTRRRVLGDAYVDASLASATDFSRDIQEYATQYCWGDLWNRPGLSLQERSLINLSMIIALNRSTEFRAHVRGAVNNGVSREKIKEVLMQSAFYCGGPAALEAFRNAAEVFEAMDAEAQMTGGSIEVTITRVGFIGLGNMGSPMAAHLVDAGFTMTVSDAAPGVTEGFVAEHPTSIAAAGRQSFATVQALILMLPTSDIVEDVLEHERVADALPPGCLVIDMSSSEPLRTRSLAARLQAKGLSMLDAPVSGGVRGARAARLSVLVGGSEADLARATPVLEAMSATIIRVGDIGTGHAAKALNNLVSAGTTSITVEALVLGQAFGITADTMTKVLNSSSGRSNTSENKLAQFMIGGSFDSGFALRLMAKDVGLALALAQALDCPLEVAGHVADQWRRLAAETSPATDQTQIYTLLGAKLPESQTGEGR